MGRTRESRQGYGRVDREIDRVQKLIERGRIDRLVEEAEELYRLLCTGEALDEELRIFIFVQYGVSLLSLLSASTREEHAAYRGEMMFWNRCHRDTERGPGEAMRVLVEDALGDNDMPSWKIENLCVLYRKVTEGAETRVED